MFFIAISTQDMVSICLLLIFFTYNILLLSLLVPSRTYGQVIAFLNYQINKLFLDLMPYLSSALISQTTQLSALSLLPHWRHCLPDSSLPPGLDYTAGLHFPASFAIRCAHLHDFWPVGCEWKRRATFSLIHPYLLYSSWDWLDGQRFSGAECGQWIYTSSDWPWTWSVPVWLGAVIAICLPQTTMISVWDSLGKYERQGHTWVNRLWGPKPQGGGRIRSRCWPADRSWEERVKGSLSRIGSARAVKSACRLQFAPAWPWTWIIPSQCPYWFPQEED